MYGVTSLAATAVTGETVTAGLGEYQSKKKPMPLSHFLIFLLQP